MYCLIILIFITLVAFTKHKHSDFPVVLYDLAVFSQNVPRWFVSFNPSLNHFVAWNCVSPTYIRIETEDPLYGGYWLIIWNKRFEANMRLINGYGYDKPNDPTDHLVNEWPVSSEGQMNVTFQFHSQYDITTLTLEMRDYLFSDGKWH